MKNKMFTLQEAALAYAKSAERILGENACYLNENEEIIPIFVSFLFQSLEISLKHIGIKSNLFTEKESRDRELTNNGHGIEKLASLSSSRLGANTNHALVTAMTYRSKESNAVDIISQMIGGEKFEPTRKSYNKRGLGYSEVTAGDFQVISDLKAWVKSIKEVAENLQETVNIISQWKESSTSSEHFAIWYQNKMAN